MESLTKKKRIPDSDYCYFFSFSSGGKRRRRKKSLVMKRRRSWSRKKGTFFNPPSFPTLLLPLFLYSSLSFSSSLWGSRVMPRQTSRPRTRHHKPSSSLLLSAENSKENFTPSDPPVLAESFRRGLWNFSAEGYEERYDREGCSETKLYFLILQSTLQYVIFFSYFDFYKLWKNKMKMSWR